MLASGHTKIAKVKQLCVLETIWSSMVNYQIISKWCPNPYCIMFRNAHRKKLMNSLNWPQQLTKMFLLYLFHSPSGTWSQDWRLEPMLVGLTGTKCSSRFQPREKEKWPSSSADRPSWEKCSRWNAQSSDLTTERKTFKKWTSRKCCNLSISEWITNPDQFNRIHAELAEFALNSRRRCFTCDCIVMCYAMLLQALAKINLIWSKHSFIWCYPRY